MARRSKVSLIEGLEPRQLFARALGIDVSSFQEPINWTQVKNSGRIFAWTKATEGFTFNDSTYTSHVNGAKAAGVYIGAYHYARPDNNSAANEVSHFLSIAGNQVKAGFLRPVLDFENPVDPLDAVNTKAELSQWANDWCNGVYSATGVKPVLYTYQSYASTYLDSSVTQWPLWMAQYPASPDPQNGHPAGTLPWASSAWQMWQYSSTTAVPGISGNCDADVFNGDATAFTNAMLIEGPTVGVTQGATAITDGQAGSVSFGSANVGGTAPSLTFTVKNNGDLPLTLSGLSVPTGYTITDNLVASLAAGVSDNFIVRLDTAVAGTKTGNISFTNNDTAHSPFNFPVTGTVAGQAAPNAPTNLAINSYTSSSVSLTWTDNASNETGFVIERRTGLNGSYAQVGTTGVNETTFIDTGVTGPAANTQYFYHVRAAIGATLSNQSNDVFTTTLAMPPTNVAASDGMFNNHIGVGWNAVSGVTTYVVYRSSINDPDTGVSIGTPSTNQFDDSSAAPNTTYYYWVASYNSSNIAGTKSAGDSGFSDNIAPSVTSHNFQSQLNLPYVEFTFSEPVATLTAANLSLTNLDTIGGITPSIGSVQWFAATNTARFSLSTFPDGNFRATVIGAQDMAGNALAGEGSQDFYFLTGDANIDRVVNALDFNALASHFGSPGAGLSGGDVNFDGNVDTQDFVAMAGNWADSLPAPIPSAPVAARPSLFSSSPVNDTDELLS